MRVLVTGGTGFMGSELTRRLLADGHAVRALVRDPKAALPPGAEPLPWRAPEPVPASAFAGVDAVVHLAGESIGKWPWTQARKRAIRDSRVLGTRALVSALAAAPRRPKVLVAASAMGWYGDRGEELLEESDPAGTGFLADVVADWEREIFAVEPSGVRAVALRFGVVLGPGRALAQMRKPFALGLGAVLGSGRQWFSWVHREDAVGAILHALAQEPLRGPVNVVSPQAVTNREFSRSLARSLRRPLLFRAPAWALRLVLGDLAREGLLVSQRASAEKLLASGYVFRYPRLDEALRREGP